MARPGPPTAALSPKFHRCIGAYTDYSRFACAAGPGRFGTTSPERRLVQLPRNRIEPVIYCTSIRQREHTCCCQLIFRPNGFRSLQPSLRVLTYHFYPLSNPVNPSWWRHPDLFRQVMYERPYRPPLPQTNTFARCGSRFGECKNISISAILQIFGKFFAFFLFFSCKDATFAFL